MLLTKGKKYSAEVTLNMFQSFGTNDQVKEYIEQRFPFKVDEVTGEGKYRQIKATYTGETKVVELDSRLRAVKSLN